MSYCVLCVVHVFCSFFFFSSRRRHTRCALVTGFRRVLFRSRAWEEYAAGQLPSATDFNVWGLDAVHGSAISGSIDGSIPEKSAAVSRRHAGRLLRRSFRRNREAQHGNVRSEEHTSELQSLMRISYAVFCLKKKKLHKKNKSN